MRRDVRYNPNESVDRSNREPNRRGRSFLQGLVIFLVGCAGIGLIEVTAELFADPATGTATLSTMAVAAVSLAAVIAGVAVAIRAARSPAQHVFHSTPLFSTAAVCLGAAAIGVTSLVVRAPFQGLAAHGAPIGDPVGDLARLAGVMVALVGAGVALRQGWEARERERTWDRALTGLPDY